MVGGSEGGARVKDTATTTTPRCGERAAATPTAVAVVDGTGELTWAQAWDALVRTAGGLAAGAVRPGERWAVLGDNAAPTLLAHAAGLLAGVGTVALSRQLTAAELAYQLADSGAVGVITGSGSLAEVLRAAEDVPLRMVVVHGAALPAGPISDAAPVRVLGWDDWLASAPEWTGPARGPAAPMLVYTSGTTGRPRGTEVRWIAPEARFEDSAQGAAAYLDTLVASARMPAGTHLVAGPLQHNGPLTAVRHLLTGEPVVIMERFDAERALAAIDSYRVSSSVMVPTHLRRMLALPAAVRERYDVSSMRMLSHTGSACPPPVKEAMIDWFGPVLVESYGGSEVGTLCRIDGVEWLRHRGSVGRAVPPYDVVVLDEHKAALPPGVPGLLGFRAPADRGIRYHHDPEKTAAAYVTPGVFTLGDIGYVDDDGYVYITDRAADMVVSGGVNLYPAESERLVATHPLVADVAVIGVPHPDLGEQLLALVVPVDPAHPPDPADLEAWCRRGLAAYKCPRRYEFVADLPRNAMNKLDKVAMRRPYWPTERTVAG
jgi:acyl-CoA synthetase (AMP-forming)/AMP-acid ligase II